MTISRRRCSRANSSQRYKKNKIDGRTGKVIFVDIQKDGDPVTHMPEMDYEKVEAAITPKTKAVIAVDLGGIVCNYEKLFEIVERKKALFTPLESDGTALVDLGSRIQKSLGRVAVFSDCAHALGASKVFDGKRVYTGAIADFTSFSFHAVKNFTTAEGGAARILLRPVMTETSGCGLV